MVSPGPTGPCLSPTLSLITIFSAGDGAAVSITIGKVPLVRALPAASVAVTVKVCLPSASAVSGVNAHFPLLSALTVPITFPLSRIDTTSPGAALPLRVGVVSLVVSPFCIGPTCGSALSTTLLMDGSVLTGIRTVMS